jgi:hypothetical protein
MNADKTSMELNQPTWKKMYVPGYATIGIGVIFTFANMAFFLIKPDINLGFNVNMAVLFCFLASLQLVTTLRFNLKIQESALMTLEQRIKQLAEKTE